ncbi:DUF2897 family protein [Thalassotalea nanhaiensis]|uniref:DUF2897 family protein n=1 Tax=Thalassotalea nanhaiensis TaxID=3065648 RepID=A0ABY9TLX8_9GAMM|nr:DUF2897 family protein [Colwelliaceae bacterium SQ345]
MTFWLIIFAVLMFIISGIYFIYKSAKKFNLTSEQLDKIKQRNRQLDEEESQD